VAGVIGANVAGWVSDLLFQSRRAPVAGILYAVLAVASIGMFFTMAGTSNEVSWAGAPQQPGHFALRPGDRILALAGTAEASAAMPDFVTWDEVSRAVAAVPARGLGGARWDPARLMVTSTGTGIPAGQQASTGVLHARITRDGRVMAVQLEDPSPAMRAGEKRKLAAGPVLAFSPIWLGLIVFVMSIAVIGTHGLLSGTATMDFGGRKGAATAVGMIDGFVYLGTGLQSFSLGMLTTLDWSYWPAFLFPFGIVGFLLLCRIWKAIPTGKRAAA
jgi:hypothetical protein